MKKLLLLIGVLGAFLAFAPTASAAPCSERCHVHLKATTQVQRWSSPERFRDSDTVYVSVRANGQRLGLADYSPCSLDYAGQGLAVRISGCSDTITARYVSYSGVRRFAIDYWTR